eukprot:TRINITY_DN94_c0_g4_i1.p1 TRINITY_DN94_c0_g4~~TRINITY_DN94_c0_g4_i1.p1  ORF type:complete len:662 (+),score=195.25 TRINITY_DN94_c0_g4_i1:62-2047(+)
MKVFIPLKTCHPRRIRIRTVEIDEDNPVLKLPTIPTIDRTHVETLKRFVSQDGVNNDDLKDVHHAIKQLKGLHAAQLERMRENLLIREHIAKHIDSTKIKPSEPSNSVAIPSLTPPKLDIPDSAIKTENVESFESSAPTVTKIAHWRQPITSLTPKPLVPAIQRQSQAMWEHMDKTYFSSLKEQVKKQHFERSDHSRAMSQLKRHIPQNVHALPKPLSLYNRLLSALIVPKDIPEHVRRPILNTNSEYLQFASQSAKLRRRSMSRPHHKFSLSWLHPMLDDNETASSSPSTPTHHPILQHSVTMPILSNSNKESSNEKSHAIAFSAAATHTPFNSTPSANNTPRNSEELTDIGKRTNNTKPPLPPKPKTFPNGVSIKTNNKGRESRNSSAISQVSQVSSTSAIGNDSASSSSSATPTSFNRFAKLLQERKLQDNPLTLIQQTQKDYMSCPNSPMNFKKLKVQTNSFGNNQQHAATPDRIQKKSDQYGFGNFSEIVHSDSDEDDENGDSNVAKSAPATIRPTSKLRFGGGSRRGSMAANIEAFKAARESKSSNATPPPTAHSNGNPSSATSSEVPKDNKDGSSASLNKSFMVSPQKRQWPLVFPNVSSAEPPKKRQRDDSTADTKATTTSNRLQTQIQLQHQQHQQQMLQYKQQQQQQQQQQ